MDVQDLLNEAELRAERTAALVRVLTAALLAVVFYFVIAVAPADSTGPMRLIVPFITTAVFAYLAVGAASYLLVRSGFYRPWMAWALTTFDLVFFFATLVLGTHILGLPLSYAVVVPAIWIAPLVMAMVALRYNPYLQAYAAGVIVVGLALCFSGALGVADGGGRVGGFLDTVIAGAPNAGRVAMLAIAGLILAFVAGRARRLLRRAIDQTVQRANLTRFLPAQLTDRMATGALDTLRAGRLQDAAVLFVDIRGFTERSEAMDPAALSGFVTEFRRLVVAAAERSGGIVDKFIGDNAMVVFGIPEPGPDDARRALACAEALLSSVREWNAAAAHPGGPVRIGVGVHWGRVFSGAVGDAARLEFTVLGDTVNVAARLEEETKRAGLPLVVSEDLLRAAHAADETGWTELAAVPLRGRHAPVRLYGRSL